MKTVHEDEQTFHGATRNPRPLSIGRPRGKRSTSLLVMALAVEAQRHAVNKRLLDVLAALFDRPRADDAENGRRCVEQRLTLEAERDELDVRRHLIAAQLPPRDRWVVERVREQHELNIACAALDERLRPVVELILGSRLHAA